MINIVSKPIEFEIELKNLIILKYYIYQTLSK